MGVSDECVALLTLARRPPAPSSCPSTKAASTRLRSIQKPTCWPAVGLGGRGCAPLAPTSTTGQQGNSGAGRAPCLLHLVSVAAPRFTTTPFPSRHNMPLPRGPLSHCPPAANNCAKPLARECSLTTSPTSNLGLQARTTATWPSGVCTARSWSPTSTPATRALYEPTDQHAKQHAITLRDTCCIICSAGL